MKALSMDVKKVEKVKQLAESIAGDVVKFVEAYSSVSIERTILRLYGVDGVDENNTPLPNKVVDIFMKNGDITRGISKSFAALMLGSEKTPQKTAEMISKGELSFEDPGKCNQEQLKDLESTLVRQAMAILDNTKKKKKAKIKNTGLPVQPWKYLIVATGNVYEDRTQAAAAVQSGADIIAQIRSTAQSLLDYVPFGPTTEGVGGTYATQANFRIMRDALDEVSEKQGRYIRLVNYSSGLCMAEIAACAALEDLDILLNDSMYGILFRDINMKRTLVDQHFSRLICGRADIIINTGEDNYLTTSDAIEFAHTVTASQLINEALAKKAGLGDELLGLGHAFEIDPSLEDSLLYEIAHALLSRNLFPNSPLKYMPPTRFKTGDIFFSHAMDTMFNLVSILTGQGIHLAGILTEASHTPLMQDRHISLGSINYVFNTAKHLSREILFNKNGFISKRADKVLGEALGFLEKIEGIGLMEAISKGWFAGITRGPDTGKGADGVFIKDNEYSNPLLEALENGK